MKSWCLVIVGDKKAPVNYPIDQSHKARNANHTNNVVYLTAKKQEDLEGHIPLISILPWSHFGRKNIGYLYAILHGATEIWDFDDDNLLLRSDGNFEIPGFH